MMQYFRMAAKCPAANVSVSWRLFFAVVLWNLLLVANPGVFSHDELQKVDHIVRFGFSDYVHFYVRMYQGAEFGQPVRPFSFLVQGLVSLAMPSYPVVGHAVDVLSHALIAVLLFYVVLAYCANRQLAWVSALVFAVSPLATFSVGWMAALMDRFYILFGLIAFAGALQFATRRAGPGALVVIGLASSLAMLSKETAAVLPAAVALLLVVPPVGAVVDRRRVVWAFALWCLPVLAFLAYRAPALAGSMAASGSSAYAVSFGNVAEGLTVYGAYPFLPSLAEAHTWIFKSSRAVALAGMAHVVLLILLWRGFSAKIAGLYVVSYIGFLAPVLLIPTKGAHYLYGSGVAFSVALAAVLIMFESRGRWALFPALLLLVVSMIHSLQSQLFIYRTGVCMNTASISLESSYLGTGKPERMQIEVDSGAPGHVLHRLTAGRSQIGQYFPVRVEVVEGRTGGRDAEAVPFVFDSSCVVHQK